VLGWPVTNGIDPNALLLFSSFRVDAPHFWALAIGAAMIRARRHSDVAGDARRRHTRLQVCCTPC